MSNDIFGDLVGRRVVVLTSEEGIMGKGLVFESIVRRM